MAERASWNPRPGTAGFDGGSARSGCECVWRSGQTALMALAVDIVSAAATTGAVGVALWMGQRSIGVAQRSVQVDGRRQAALEIAQWLQTAETGILAWHNPDNWVVPEDVEFGPHSRVRPGDVLPPSQGRMGPSVEASIERFDEIRGLARLAFGPQDEVSRLVQDVIGAIQRVADRGVIYAESEPGPTPHEYVERVFLPLVHGLFESLAKACELRDP